jgi:GTP-dependent phosphoenolpyruvate carboxykinase
LENGETLNAQILNFNNQAKTVDIGIAMNGQTQVVSGTFDVVDNKLEAQFEIDVNNWDASIDKLNEVCEDLHKGADGKSILWPNVTIYLLCGFNEICE